MHIVLIQDIYAIRPGVAARPGAERPYERHKYTQTTPSNRRIIFFLHFFQKRLGKVLEYIDTGVYAARRA